MALTVKDILELDSLRGIQLIAGKAGLSRSVVSAGIADFEFADFADSHEKDVFLPDSIVMSSLLFAKENPALILSAVKELHAIGAAAFAYKPNLFSVLPAEVLDFAEANDFPILQFTTGQFMDEIIFDIMDAVRKESDNFFSEENIDKMISDGMTKAQVYALSKNVSIKFKEHIMTVYLKSDNSNFLLDLDRYTKKFYLNRALMQKALLCKYKDGLFAVLTARQNNERSFEIILSELMEFLSLPEEDLYINCSLIHDPFKDLDQCIRESYFTYIASAAEQKHFRSFKSIGPWQLLIPYAHSDVMKDYMNARIQPILEKQDFYETARALTICRGDIFKTASLLNCHHNTVRYRLNKIKQFLFTEDMSDQEFYTDISLAVRLYMLQE
ncbi:PucR family transcriptional regulator [Ihubacter sp. rT4E-8]|uniref:PucR family transcriptional regulator n=1 Tax=Ihubacter sp. rT4E-8 TaxID=3242369 RepID=UPI003CF56123